MHGRFGFAIAAHHQFRKHRDPGGLKCLAVSCETLRVRLVAVLVADVGNAAVAQAHEVLCHNAHAFHIADHDGVDKGSRMLIVDEDDGHHHLRQQRKIQRANPGRGDDDAVDPLLGKRLDDFLFAAWIGIRVGEIDAVSVVVGGLFNAGDDFASKRVGDRGDDEPNGPCPPRDKASCNGAGSIA